MNLDIAFLIPGMPFNGATLAERSLGGSETAGLCLARAMAARGHRVLVFSNTDSPGIWDGVRYFPMGMYEQFLYGTPHDVTVVQRSPEVFSRRTTSRLNVLWCHDLALKRSGKQFAGCLWNVDKLAVVSEWMRDQYREVHALDEALLHVAPNGVDLSLFPEPMERDPNLLVYTARPERGLDVLLERIMPRIIEARPEAKLIVAGYDNQVEHLRFFYRKIQELMGRLGGKHCEWGGHLSKRDLYDLYSRAGAYVYPTPSPVMTDFCEVHCITALECMACGLPFVSTRRGALPETLDERAGILLDDPGEFWSDDACDAFAGAVVELMGDAERRDDMAKAGRQSVKGHDWALRAEAWEDAMLRWIDERNDDPVRLAYHFIRRSDIMAAYAALDGASDVHRAGEIRAVLDHHYPFAADASLQSARLEAGNNYVNDSFDVDGGDPRLHEIMRWLEAHPDVRTVLDVGCSLGTMAVHLSNRFPHLHITGMDMDPEAISWALRNREQRADFPENLSFFAGTDADIEGMTERYDLVLCGETLEHVNEPWTFLDRIQTAAAVSGWIYLTVPWGPWEQMSYRTMPARSHLWEFDAHDLQDMLGEQVDLVIDSRMTAQSTISGEALGHYYVTFRASAARIRPIDMARKLRLQRPRQTVSASIMAGGPGVEETARWCLHSIRDLVDEIVVADTGLTVEGRRIFEAEGARIVPAPSPLDEGFEAPRNVALDQCRMDWVLWIDTDEKLVDPQNADKYLRENTYDGYGVRQHHFSIDHPLNPDTPIRLFRRRPLSNGKRLRHLGMLHEHPETGVNEGAGRVIILSDLNIAHVGYLSETIRRKRFQRNLPMLERDMAKYPDRLLQKHFLCRDKMLMASYILQQTGGGVTPDVERLAREVVDLYREYFLGKSVYYNVDTLPYYSQACRILGIGIDVEFNVKANRDGVGDQLNGAGEHVRFASAEDALAEMSARARSALEPLEGRYW